MDDAYITPDFVQPSRAARGQAPQAAAAPVASNFFQENKMMIIVFGIVVVVVICLLLFVMTRDKKPEPNKRPPPGNQNGPQQGGPPPGNQNGSQQGGPPPAQQAPPQSQQPQPQNQNGPPPVERRVQKAEPKVAQVIETADDDEVNKYMNLGEDNDEDELESSDANDNIVVKKTAKGGKSAQKKGDFDDLDEYESSSD